MAVQTRQQPEAGKGCTVASQVVAVVVAAEIAAAEHVAVAVAVVVVAVAAVATGSFVSHHTRNLHTEQIALEEGAVVRARELGQAQMATVDCMLAALEVDPLLLPKPPPNTPNSPAGWPEEVVDLEGGEVAEGCMEEVAGQRDSCAS